MSSIRRRSNEDHVSVDNAETEQTVFYAASQGLTSSNGLRHLQIGTEQGLLCRCEIIGLEQHGDVTIDLSATPMDEDKPAMQSVKNRSSCFRQRLQVHTDVLTGLVFFLCTGNKLVVRPDIANANFWRQE